MTNKKNNKKAKTEIIVSFSLKKNGRYYAKEELTLDEFKKLILDKQILISSRPKLSFIDRLLGGQKRFNKDLELMNLLFEKYKFKIIMHIRDVMQYDGPGKKMFK